MLGAPLSGRIDLRWHGNGQRAIMNYSLKSHHSPCRKLATILELLGSIRHRQQNVERAFESGYTLSAQQMDVPLPHTFDTGQEIRHS